MYFSNYKFRLSTSDWKKFSASLKKKADYKCQMCGSNVKLTSHHMTYEYVNSPVEWMSIMVICDNCHTTYHKVHKHPPIKKCIDRVSNFKHHIDVLKKEGIDTSYSETVNHDDWNKEPVFMPPEHIEMKPYTIEHVDKFLNPPKETPRTNVLKFDPLYYIELNKDDESFLDVIMCYQNDFTDGNMWNQILVSQYNLPPKCDRPENWRYLIAKEVRKINPDKYTQDFFNPSYDEKWRKDIINKISLRNRIKNFKNSKQKHC
jgi:hypothetical protein